MYKEIIHILLGFKDNSTMCGKPYVRQPAQAGSKTKLCEECYNLSLLVGEAQRAEQLAGA